MSSIFSNPNYLKITYNNKTTKYPELFCKYMFNSYPRTYKILDIGCGNGDFTNELIKMGFDVYAVDAVRHPNNKIELNKFKTCNLNNGLPITLPQFDIIFSKSVVEHLTEPNRLIKDSHSHLKTNGKIITMTPSWKHSYKEQFYIDHTHVTPFTRYSLKTIHEIEGFKDITCSYFYQLPITWKHPNLLYGIRALNLLNLPYRPFEEITWPEEINKFIRFSKEAMLLCIGTK